MEMSKTKFGIKKKTLRKKGTESNELKVHPGLKIFFGYNLYKTGLLFRDFIQSAQVHHFNLSAPESGVLYILSTGSIMNQLNLGQELGIDKATIVKIIDKLERMELVKRMVSAEDRRSKNVKLTPKGKNMIEKVRNFRSKIENDIFASFSREDENHIKRLVPQLLEVLINKKLVH
jgi:DNA-binding MarR family transcriptional regulator